MTLAADHSELEVENGFRQFDLCLEVVDFYLDRERPFALRPGLIFDFQKEAVRGIEAEAGQIRQVAVGITHSEHNPPPAHMVEFLVTEMCEYINNNWHEKTAFHLAAYAMWRLNWIHPFTDGNGRTARTLSYAILCIKLGYRLPGSPTIPAQIEMDKSYYLTALASADQAEIRGATDISEMEQLIRDTLARQLMGVIEAAGGVEPHA